MALTDASGNERKGTKVFEFDIFPIGSEVRIKGTELIGTVTGLNLQGSMQGAVKHNVLWWDGTARHEEWLYGFEIQCKSHELARIGFKQSAT